MEVGDAATELFPADIIIASATNGELRHVGQTYSVSIVFAFNESESQSECVNFRHELHDRTLLADIIGRVQSAQVRLDEFMRIMHAN